MAGDVGEMADSEQINISRESSENCAKRTKRNDKLVSIWILPAVGALMIFLWVGWPFAIWKFSPQVAESGGRIAAAGQLGDIYGGINALFSGLAFAALIYTVYLQRKELSFQRQELAETREVFEKQEKQMQGQNQALRKQIFESRFFQWVNLHLGLVGAMETHAVKGRSVLTYARDFTRGNIENAIIKIHRLEPFTDRQALESTVRRLAGDDFKLDKDQHKAVLLQAFAPVYLEHRNQLVHYFENLHALFAFLINSGLSLSDRNFYANVLKAQLSVAELFLLFIYGLTDQGIKFNGIIQQFGLLSNMDDTDFFAPEHRDYYPVSAYSSIF